MPRCRNCGSHVTERFARVFGDNDGYVHGCIDCAKNTDLYDGAGTRGADGVDPPTAEWRA